MSKSAKRNFTKEVESVLHAVLVKHKRRELSLHEIAMLVIEGGQIDDVMLDGVRDKAVEKYFGQVLRSARFVDAHGEEIRKYHSYSKFVQSDDGKEVQLNIWRTIETMTSAQMSLSVKARWLQGIATQRKAITDGKYWEEHVAPKHGYDLIGKQLGLW